MDKISIKKNEMTMVLAIIIILLIIYGVLKIFYQVPN
jgi:hypothetical protein